MYEMSITLGRIEGMIKAYEMGLTTPEKCLASIQEVLKDTQNEQAKKKAS